MLLGRLTGRHSLTDELREEGTPYISPIRFAERMHISLQSLADLAQVHRSTLQRSPGTERAQAYMREALGIIGMVLELNGGDSDRAIYWYRNTPLTELGGGTAESFVREGKAEAVRRCVRNLSAGATG